MSAMSLTPPTDPGPIWITLADDDGSEVFGFWRSEHGFRAVDCETLMTIELEHDVIAWRPHGPEGEVSWEVEAQLKPNGDWQEWGRSAGSLELAREYRDHARDTNQCVVAARIVKVIRIVQREEV